MSACLTPTKSKGNPTFRQHSGVHTLDADLKNKCYYFDIVTNPGYYYVDLMKLDLYDGAPVLKLDTSHTESLVGCANSHLKKSAPFTPMY